MLQRFEERRLKDVPRLEARPQVAAEAETDEGEQPPGAALVRGAVQCFGEPALAWSKSSRLIPSDTTRKVSRGPWRG